MRRAPSLRARLLTTLLVVGLVQLLAVGLALWSLSLVRDEQRRVTGDFYSTVQDSSNGYATVLRLQSAARAYLRSGAAEDLAAVQEVQQSAGGVGIEVLRHRLRGQRQALEALERVSVSAQTWGATLQKDLGLVQQQGPAAVNPADRVRLSDQFDVVARDYGSYISAVQKARDDGVRVLDDRTTTLFYAVLIAVGTAVVAGLVLYAALRTWVTRPLARLGEETRTVRSGELDHEVQVGGPPEVVGLGRDVEAMRVALVAQVGELRRVQARLEQQAEELQRSNRDLEQFAYVASHDLQEPLRKVSSFCQMLERRYSGQLDERADQYIAFAVDGAKRMQALINDLLAFSRVGRITDGTTEVAMEDVLADALRNLSAAVEESGAVVTSDPLPVVHAERRLLVQLVQNLVGNAVKFAGDARPEVHVSARRDGEVWELSVSDNGIGIEPRYAERIFVIFQRLHPKSEYEGTGIGLALCKKIVEYHGGTIWLDETAERGATFRWTIPVEPRVSDEPATDADADVDTGTGTTTDTPGGPPAVQQAPAGAGQEAAWTAV